MRRVDLVTAEDKEKVDVVEGCGHDDPSYECRGGKTVTHDENLFATIIDRHVICYDVRDGYKKPSHEIEDAHLAPILDLDFNPNKPFALCTGGEDCSIRFWDIRKSESPLLTFQDDSHWI